MTFGRLRAIAPEEQIGIGELASRLVGDAKHVARAEVALYKARAIETVELWKAAAILFAVAGVLALAALIALLVGAILTLATLVGPGWATLIVVGAVLVLAGLSGWLGARRLKAKPAVTS